MTPKLITEANIAEALRRIIREGIPPRRRGRGYCVVANGKHFPPKYTIALAHQVATGEPLSPDRFSGGVESNRFLQDRGFAVVPCDCGGSGHDYLRVAMVFPEVDLSASNGIPPSGPEAQQPDVPVAASFVGEAVDFVLFPEGYICTSDGKRIGALRKLASNLGAPLWWARSTEASTPPAAPGRFCFASNPTACAPRPGSMRNTPARAQSPSSA